MDADEVTDAATNDTPRTCRPSERGANLIEYCLLVTLVLLACLAGVTQFGRSVPSDSFTSVNAAL